MSEKREGAVFWGCAAARRRVRMAAAGAGVQWGAGLRWGRRAAFTGCYGAEGPNRAGKRI